VEEAEVESLAARELSCLPEETSWVQERVHYLMVLEQHSRVLEKVMEGSKRVVVGAEVVRTTVHLVRPWTRVEQQVPLGKCE